MDMRIPPRRTKIMIESNPLTSIMLVRRLAVCPAPGRRGGCPGQTNSNNIHKELIYKSGNMILLLLLLLLIIIIMIMILIIILILIPTLLLLLLLLLLGLGLTLSITYYY